MLAELVWRCLGVTPGSFLPPDSFFFLLEHMNSCQIPTEPTSSVCHLTFETLAQWAWESACCSLVLALLFSVSSKSYKERSISLPTGVELHLSAFLVSVMYSESLYFTSSVIQYPQEHCYLQVLSKKKTQDFLLLRLNWTVSSARAEHTMTSSQSFVGFQFKMSIFSSSLEMSPREIWTLR